MKFNPTRSRQKANNNYTRCLKIFKLILGNDYLKDEEFGDMYKYLRHNQLTGDSETDRRLLLIAENYYVENDLLYKICLLYTSPSPRD